jgi:hypothetical protein
MQAIPYSRTRSIFSIVTVASSTRKPTANASPPSVVVLIVSPSKLRMITELRIVNLRMPDSIATRRHLFWLSFLAPFLLPERARMSGRYRRYLLALDRQDMPSRIASTVSIHVLYGGLSAVPDLR